MEKIRRIMVPVAFSEHSAALIVYAATLASSLGAEMLLVNVINERDVEILERITSYGYEIDEEQYIRELENERVTDLNNMLADLDFPDDRIRIIFRIGRPAQTLMKVALEEEADMIVMGICDRTDFIHSLTGSVAEKLFRRSPVTIVSYRDEKNAEYLRKRLEN